MSRIVLWPIYFDSTRSRMQGRRISKNLAVPSPRLDEIHQAAKRIGLQSERVTDAAHPSAPWQKTGFLFVSKRGRKGKTIQEVAKELIDIRK